MDVIRALYHEVFTLEECLYHCDSSGILRSTLIKDKDSESYKDLVRTTLVGLTEPGLQCSSFSLSQNSYQREVVLRVIERLIKRDGTGKNILTLGFNMMSDDVNAQISSGVSVEYRYPNNNVNRLHFRVWKQLLTRIGDDRLMYLLEKASIFILLAPTCYLQIAGNPVYNAWPYEVGKTFSVKQPSGKKSIFHHKAKRARTVTRSSDTERKIKPRSISDLDERLETENETTRKGIKRKAVFDKPNTDMVVEREFKRPRLENVLDKSNKKETDNFKNCKGGVEMCYVAAASSGDLHSDAKLDMYKSSSTENIHTDFDFGHEYQCTHSRSHLKRQSGECSSETDDSEYQQAKRIKMAELPKSVSKLETGSNSLQVISTYSALEKLKTITDNNQTLLNIPKSTDDEKKTDADGFHINMQKNEVLSALVEEKPMKEAKNDSENTEIASEKTERAICGIEETVQQSIVRHSASEGAIKDDVCNSEKTENIRDPLQRFKPYDHLLYLPKAGLLYNRNIREKFQKSVMLSSVDDNNVCVAQFLYKKIFCETLVHSEIPLLEVTTPDITTVVSCTDMADSLQRRSSSCTVGSLLSGSEKNKDQISEATNTDHPVNSENNVLGDIIVNKSVIGAHLNCMNFNSSLVAEKSNTSEGSVRLVGNREFIEANSTCTGPESDNWYIKGNVVGEAEREIMCPLGMRKLEMLLQRKASILKSRRQTNGSFSVFSKTAKVNENSSSKKTPSRASCDGSNTGISSLLENSVNSESLEVSGKCSPDLVGDSTRFVKGISIEEVVGYADKMSVSEFDGYECKTSSKNTSSYESCKEIFNSNVEKNVCSYSKIETESKRFRIDNTSLKPTEDAETESFIINSQTGTINETVAKPTEGLSHYETTEFQAFRNKNPVMAEMCNKEGTEGNMPVEGQSEIGTEGRREEQVKIQIPFMPKLLELLEEFAKKHRRCPYRVLLQHHCPLPWRGDKSSLRRVPLTKETVSRLLSDHTHPRKVYLFLRACFLKTFPVELLGSSHNRNIVLKNVSKIVSYGKFEKVCLGQLMSGLKTSEIPWFHDLPTNNLKLHLLAKLIYWFFSDYIITLLKTYFYITETTFTKYRLLYYRQSVWNKLCIQGFSGLLKNKILKPLAENVAEDMLKKGTSLGVCVLRFLPKQGSLRPIMNMSKSTCQLTSKKLSINQQLTDLLHILTYMKDKEPSLVGSGKFGMDDVYTSWEQYHTNWKETGKPQLYFVKTDIVNCYDTILQKKLYTVLEDVFSQIEDDFVVRKYASVMVARGNLKRTFHRGISPLSEYEPDFVRVAKEMVTKNEMHDVVLVDKVLHQHENKESLLQLLQSHLFSSIVKVGSKYFHQTCGISQGSVLSTLLCSMYYASMERDYFRIAEDEMLMRIVDDYLYITPSKDNALKFLDLMLNGIPEYNCFVNADKVLTNFPYNSEKFGPISYETGIGFGCSLQVPTSNVLRKKTFPWCGILLNPRTLEVGVEYSRYSGYRISDSITFDLCHKPGIAMKKKLLFSSRPKCHRMYMDHRINTEHQIGVNCYHLFLLSAYKFCSYIVKLPREQRAEDNPRFFYGIIHDLPKYVYRQANKGLKSSKRQKTGSEGFVLSQENLKWLCLKAFQSVLLQHHSLFKKLLRLVRRGLRSLERKKYTGRTGPLPADVLLKLDKQFAEILK